MSYNCVSGYYHVFYLLEMYSIGLLFLPALAYRRAGIAVALFLSLCLYVSVCVCLSHVGVLLKRLKGSSWLLA